MKQQIIDSKANPNATGEADDCLFEYLHAELVNYVLSKSSNAAVSNVCVHKMIVISNAACMCYNIFCYLLEKNFSD